MPIDLTTVFQAVPYVQNVAHAELVNPQAQLMAAQTLAQQVLVEQNKQTQRIEQQEALDSVHDEEKKNASGRRRSRRGKQVQADTEETQASNSTPYAGHIINMKV
ncbi:hypothetical protein [Desulfovibrio sp. TomC]|uniref:hypothetical protein n=1 Tax=Desulfovibrio sp. TomC TaxID=1562888 RepID=UPI000573FB8E|nr:hypothetical protein [Desulfovibrio sp. TomC]KHK04383.1 hypothetical protein NY78_0161 [Desulfovibrio sp. TomC]